MRILAPLRRPAIFRLWLGQVLSNVGDEIYGIALIWIAADLIGPDAGYVAALQSASVFLSGLLAARFAETWDHRRTMVCVDVLRGLAVLLIPLLHAAVLGLLVPVAALVSGLSAFFLPALKASLPDLAADEDLLHTTNGLMESTLRLARIVGPGLIGLLHGLVATLHFFTIDALSFFCSAFSIASLHRDLPPPSEHAPVAIGLRESWRAVRRHPALRFVISTSPLASSLWWLVLPLGMTLLVHQRRPDDVGALGWLVCAYGVGNLGCNLVVGSARVAHPFRLMLLGRMTAGVGFVALALAPSYPLMLLSSALAASGGPMTDLGYLALLQRSGDRRHIARTYRLGMSIDYFGIMLVFLASPWIFRWLGPAPAILGCGLLIFISGAAGLAVRNPGEAGAVEQGSG
jgi:hypothetical protein